MTTSYKVQIRKHIKEAKKKRFEPKVELKELVPNENQQTPDAPTFVEPKPKPKAKTKAKAKTKTKVVSKKPKEELDV